MLIGNLAEVTNTSFLVSFSSQSRCTLRMMGQLLHKESNLAKRPIIGKFQNNLDFSAPTGLKC